jgi:predicted Mrr-cat superfamily restriction endonuclease
MKFSKEELNGIENRKKVLEEKKKGELEEEYEKALASYSSISEVNELIKDGLISRLGLFVINELRGEEEELEEIDERANELETKLEILEDSIKNLRVSIKKLKDNGKIFSIYKRFEKELDRRS